ncbi:MAG TPA: hypothetical protein VF746_27540 [Longimicrobium sp.]|jgi:hypothetical protein
MRIPACVLLLPLLASPACSGEAPAADAYETPLVSTFRTTPGFRWRRVDAPKLRVYVQPGSYAARHAAELAALAARARADAYRLLELGEDGRTLHVFYVEDRAQMGRLTGQAVRGGTAYPEERVAVVAASARRRPSARHEAMHAVSIGAWGRSPAGDWVQEGVAVLAEGTCGPYDLETVAAFLVQSGRALPLDRLTGAFRAQDDLTAYLQAGGLLGHLRARHGTRAVRALWTGGPAALERAAGRPLADVERDWRREMAAAPPREVDWATLSEAGCGWRGR